MSVFDRYIPRKVDGITDIEVLARSYKHRKNVLLIGDAGVGKNHLIDALGAKLGIPTVSISLNGGSTVEDIVGQPLFIGGETVWADGLLPHLMVRPSILCLDEINACPNDISFILHQVLDWRRRLVLVQKGREVIQSDPGFMIVGTMNPDYRGTKPLNEAFKDRFQVTLELDYDRKIETKLGIDEIWLDLADQLRKMYRETELETPCSTRMLMDYRDNTEIFGQDVARECFIARYTRTEQKAVKHAISIHIDKSEISNLADEETNG
jgi:MoxR-like ATPase